MKNTVILIVFGIMTCVFVCSLTGCTQPGETAAEGRRRHLRNQRINQQGLNSDIDTFLLADQPSKLSDKRIP